MEKPPTTCQTKGLLSAWDDMRVAKTLEAPWDASMFSNENLADVICTCTPSMLKYSEFITSGVTVVLSFFRCESEEIGIGSSAGIGYSIGIASDSHSCESEEMSVEPMPIGC